jgi:hypothetical protein
VAIPIEIAWQEIGADNRNRAGRIQLRAVPG